MQYVVWYVTVGECTVLEESELGLGESAEVTRRVTLGRVVSLTLGELGNERDCAVAAGRVLQGRPALRPCGQEMALQVTVARCHTSITDVTLDEDINVRAEWEVWRIPSTICGCAISREPMVDAKDIEIAVDIDVLEVAERACLILLKPAAGERYGAEIELPGADTCFVLDGCSLRECDRECDCENNDGSEPRDHACDNDGGTKLDVELECSAYKWTSHAGELHRRMSTYQSGLSPRREDRDHSPKIARSSAAMFIVRDSRNPRSSEHGEP